MHNDVLQTDILAKANLLKSLEDIVKHAEAFEIAVPDQQALQNSNSNNLVAARISDYKKQKHSQPKKTCSGCGSQYHQLFEHSCACHAWGKICLNCNTKNHFPSICRQPKKIWICQCPYCQNIKRKLTPTIHISNQQHKYIYFFLYNNIKSTRKKTNTTD